MPTFLEWSHREYRTFVTDNTGLQPVLPVIITEQGVLNQFAKYLYLHRNRSRSWQDCATFSVQLLLEFIIVNHHFYNNPKELFSAFSNSLYAGTISNRWDASNLWWTPRQPDNAAGIINHITLFSDWLAQVNEESKLQLNPWRLATCDEQRLNWAAYIHRRENAFLSHLWSAGPNIKNARSVRFRKVPIERQAPTKMFPEEFFSLLVLDGFRRATRGPHGSTDLRNILITYLMHYGGLRISEALSIWTSDVSVEEGEVIVRIYHPESGLAPGGKENRAVYLQRKYGLQSRNRLVKSTDPLFLGWKNSLITDPHNHCFEVFFYPEYTGVVFAKMWRDYHLIQRVKPRLGEEHPYAFTNKEGRPYSHRMFRKAHKLGVERIGLVYGKMYGTTPHGHRHSYGQRLALDGVDLLLIKSAMHHASIQSSEIYTRPTAKQMRQSLRDLEAKLQAENEEQIYLNVLEGVEMSAG